MRLPRIAKMALLGVLAAAAYRTRHTEASASPNDKDQSERARADELKKTATGYDFTFDGVHIPVTFSAGVAELQDELNALEMLKHADARLYEAKRTGRNRVC